MIVRYFNFLFNILVIFLYKFLYKYYTVLCDEINILFLPSLVKSNRNQINYHLWDKSHLMNFKRNTTLSIRRQHRRACSRRLARSRRLPRNSNRASVDFGLMSATKQRSCFPSAVYKLALIQGGRMTHHACLRFVKRELRVIYFGSTLATTVRFRSSRDVSQSFLK